MGFWEMALQVLSHPAVQPLVQQALWGPNEEQDQALRRVQAQQQVLDQLLEEYHSSTVPRAATRRKAPPPAARAVPAIRDALARVAADYKEALRFARADGMDHPEVQDRLQDAELHIAEVERYWMAPERLAGVPKRAQPVVDALATQFRTFRQAALNGTTTVEALAERAGEAGRQAAQWTALGAALPTIEANATVTPATSHTLTPPADQAYSTYAPEMGVGVSCLPCGRAHLAAVAASLRKAAQLPAEDPEAAERVAMANEELTALLAYDWTPEKIAATPEPDRAKVQALVPEVQALLQTVRTARTPAEWAQAADQAEAIRRQVREEGAA